VISPPEFVDLVFRFPPILRSHLRHAGKSTRAVESPVDCFPILFFRVCNVIIAVISAINRFLLDEIHFSLYNQTAAV
jgi:hypothetical protein